MSRFDMPSGLLLLVDGRFPAGGHANSAGVESAVRCSDVVDASTLGRYLAGRLAVTGRVDAAFAAHVCGLDGERDDLRDAVLLADHEYAVRTLSPALRSASRRFGRQLVRSASSVWAGPTLAAVTAVAGGVNQPVALGAVTAAAGGTPRHAAMIALHHVSAAVATAGVRLLGLDPVEVSVVQARATDLIDEISAGADDWSRLPASELPADGGSLTEILAEDHAAWDSRLFAV